ncbi:MAG: hypothetical protein RJQ01_06525 [Microcella sp.]|uniref:hypothetical protein n=1 Tax=Microcella sp. TaxID=1913979 RepID=UPI003315E373
MATKKTNTAPLAAHAAKDITPTMQTFAEWLTTQTGYKVDPLSVQLGSALRGTWQAETRAAKESASAAPKRAPRKLAEKPAPKPRAKRGATIATAEGVVIAEQRHVEVA